MATNNSRGKIPFGLKDGRLWYVSEVPTGLECGCICPDPTCAKPLIARNHAFPGRKRIFHFRHASLTAGCGGRESALHRMGKDVVERATAMLLPSWSAEDLTFDAYQANLLPGISAQEVLLSEHQMRPDVLVGAMVGRIVLSALYVEIKVAHAVDSLKRQRAIDAGVSMVEIDLSDVPDELVGDEEAFAQDVLHNPENRRWVNIGSAPFLATMTGGEIVQVVSACAREKIVRTQKGSTLHFRAQDALCYIPGSDTPRVVEVELADTIHGGKSVDQFGNTLPYAPGLYRRFPSERTWSYQSRDFKTHLKRVRQDERLAAQMELL